MLILTDVETLYRIPDNDLNKLTAKDKVVIFSKSGSQMPMSKFQALAAIKAKMEIVEYPEEIEKIDDLETQSIYIGYLFGMYAAGAKAGGTGKQAETVKIYSSLFDVIAKGGDKNAPIRKSMGNVIFAGTEENKSVKKKTTVKKADSSKVVETPVAEPVKQNKKTAAANKKTDNTPAKGKSSKLISTVCAMGLQDMKDLLISREDMLKKAISDAKDGEIGYKFQLKMYFGEDSEKIWERTNKNFDKLKTMISV